MGCDSYEVSRYVGGDWKSATLALNYDREGWPCLCTMHGDSHNGMAFSAEDVRSMAALGAALVLAHRGTLTDEYLYAPSDLPERVQAAIEYFIPVAAESRP